MPTLEEKTTTLYFATHGENRRFTCDPLTFAVGNYIRGFNDAFRNLDGTPPITQAVLVKKQYQYDLFKGTTTAEIDSDILDVVKEYYPSDILAYVQKCSSNQFTYPGQIWIDVLKVVVSHQEEEFRRKILDTIQKYLQDEVETQYESRTHVVIR